MNRAFSCSKDHFEMQLAIAQKGIAIATLSTSQLSLVHHRPSKFLKIIFPFEIIVVLTSKENNRI